MRTSIFKLVILSLLLVSCEKFNTSAKYNYKAPEQENDGIEVSTLEKVNIDTRIIEEAVNEIERLNK